MLDKNADWRLLLINPEHCKALRGKKTDLKDGERISDLLQHGFKDNYLSAQFKRLAIRRGSKRALMAVANTILRIAYHLITHQTVYRDLGADYFDRGHEQQLTRRLVKRLEKLGHEVVLRPGTG